MTRLRAKDFKLEVTKTTSNTSYREISVLEVLVEYTKLKKILCNYSTEQKLLTTETESIDSH